MSLCLGVATLVPLLLLLEVVHLDLLCRWGIEGTSCRIGRMLGLHLISSWVAS